KSSYQPFFSILIPTFNEASLIRKRIENLLTLEYPHDRYEILVIDSGSTDGTAEVVQELVQTRREKVPPLRLVRENERRGKGSAVRTGRSLAGGEIILVSDANATFHPGVLGILGAPFADPEIGGVGGRYCVGNPGQKYTQGASFYWDLECLMRNGEAALDSACLFHGEINAWRKDLVEPDPSILCEDLDLALQIRRSGNKIGYEPRAIVYEPAATTTRDIIIQRKKVASGTLQIIGKNIGYFLVNPGWYNWLIFPSHKILPLLTPFLLVLVLLLYLAIGNVQVIFGHVVVCMVGLGIILVGLRSVLRTEPCGGARHFPGRLIPLLKYVLLNEVLVGLGWWDFLTGRYTVLWEKVESTRT
ncbi:MAG: glycosyltransferase, partial [Methanoregulaceae archaeon]|nr:glycosyltransferase [Methanoregulaceae archaeon]